MRIRNMAVGTKFKFKNIDTIFMVIQIPHWFLSHVMDNAVFILDLDENLVDYVQVNDNSEGIVCQ